MVIVAAVAVAVAGAVVLGGCGDSNDETASTTATMTTKSSSTCPTRGVATNASYASRFEGNVDMKADKHVVVVTRNGQPVKGASVCVNTAMVGMTSMHYSARGREIAPGRYEVPVKFEMEGTYRGNLVANDAVSVPLTVKVGAAKAMDDDKMSTTTTDDTMQDDEKMSTTTTDDTMQDDEKMSTTTTGAMKDDEDGK